MRARLPATSKKTEDFRSLLVDVCGPNGMANACFFLKKSKKGWSNFSVKGPAEIDNSGVGDPYPLAREGYQGLLVPAAEPANPVISAQLGLPRLGKTSSLHGPHFNPPTTTA